MTNQTKESNILFTASTSIQKFIYKGKDDHFQLLNNSN